jgi:hypothetical protein
LLLALAACSGSIDAGGAGNEPGGAAKKPPAGTAAGSPAGTPGLPTPGVGTDNPGAASPAPKAELTLGTTKLRRVTRLEYNNLVRDLLGDTTRPGISFGPDLDGESGFLTGGIVSRVEADQYLDAGERLAAAAVKMLDKLVPCSPTGAEDACASEFIAKFGRRTYRRPLSTEETRDLQDLYDWAKANKFDYATRVQFVLTAMLQSPNFLYRWEFGRAVAGKKDLNALTSYELASRLSFALWGSMPDDDLSRAADAGTLIQPAELEKQARRMLDSPKARDAAASFKNGWLHFIEGGDIQKDPKRFKTWNAVALAAVDAETEEFVVRAVTAGEDALKTLFTADFTWGNEAVAKFYGVAGITGTEVQKIPLGAGRAGILTQASLLARNSGPSASSPVRRGHMIREQFLCDEPPPPPKDLNPQPPVDNGMMSIRQQVLDHQNQPSCRACHQLMDGFGLALEGFDAVGLVRTMDAGQPIDASGEVLWPGQPAPVRFNGVRELGAKLGADGVSQRCFVQQYFRFALGRKEQNDVGTIDAALDGFKKARFSIRELVVAVVKSDAFRYRKILEGEVQQ